MRDKRVAILESRLGRQMVELVAKHGGCRCTPALAGFGCDPAYVERLVHDAQTRPQRLRSSRPASVRVRCSRPPTSWV